MDLENKNHDPVEHNRLRPTRRRVLGTIGAAGLCSPVLATLPSEWRRPIVESLILPAHAQTTCANRASRLGRADHDDCPVVTLNAEIGNANARLRTPSGTVNPILSLVNIRFVGCCNAVGHTVQVTAAKVNLTNAQEIDLATTAATVAPNGRFSLLMIAPDVPVAPLDEIANITVDMNCDDSAPITVVVQGATVASVAGGNTPVPTACSF